MKNSLTFLILKEFAVAYKPFGINQRIASLTTVESIIIK
jgi:hypothetical protein